MFGKGIVADTGVAVAIKGTLHVGVIRDGGEVTGLYRLDGETQVDD